MIKNLSGLLGLNLLFGLSIYGADAPIDLTQGETFSQFVARLFSADFMPHGHCFFWRPGLLWLHAVSDGFIVLAYYSIPLMLVYFAHKRKDIPFNWMFALFGAFIFACGTTHLVNIVTLWNPVYRVEGVIKAVTAAVSVLTAVMLFPLIPRALALRSPWELEEVNQRLKLENELRRETEKKLEDTNRDLEKRISERTEALRRKGLELERSNSDLEKFASIASHDLKEPLRIIGAYCELIRRDVGSNLDPQSRTYLDFAVDGARRMNLLIDDLMEFSSVSRGQQRWEKVDLKEVVNQSVSNLKVALEESGAKVEVGELPIVEANLMAMVRLFQNLIANAIKYRKPGVRSEVKVTAVPVNEAEWQFTVSDNGIGIPAEQFDQIFVLFRRLHSREEYPGTGMGLAIAKRIVESHGGQIWVESTVHIGSAFHFRIPASQTVSVEPPQRELSSHANQTGPQLNPVP